ncbi:MAG: hypothetical protein CVU09_04860 [Bacteroidetes bacterium HGW-Bacteroidetes-4]|nr:MAG: hypothetical protein CVU09_04860 [Bacteroidetes bacterium HGW-Bacteroidetes-4]
MFILKHFKKNCHNSINLLLTQTSELTGQNGVLLILLVDLVNSGLKSAKHKMKWRVQSLFQKLKFVRLSKS